MNAPNYIFRSVCNKVGTTLKSRKQLLENSQTTNFNKSSLKKTTKITSIYLPRKMRFIKVRSKLVLIHDENKNHC